MENNELTIVVNDVEKFKTVMLKKLKRILITNYLFIKKYYLKNF